MRLPRFRLRTLLIGVAFVALAIGGWQMCRRREFCLERAYWHSDQADWYRVDFRQISIGDFYAETRRAACLEEAAREEKIADRYRHVARYPWLPLPEASLP